MPKVDRPELSEMTLKEAEEILKRHEIRIEKKVPEDQWDFYRGHRLCLSYFPKLKKSVKPQKKAQVRCPSLRRAVDLAIQNAAKVGNFIHPTQRHPAKPDSFFEDCSRYYAR